MTGRSLHDAFLTVLCDGKLRGRLLEGETPLNGDFSSDEWTVLTRLPKRRLIGLSRFFARHYYHERIVRLFRYVRLLAPWTGRDPCRVLHDPAILPMLEGAVLGSPASAARILAAVEHYLTEDDEAIQAQWPFWRDLVRYQAALFQVEAHGAAPRRQTQHPFRSPGARILDFEWDIPDVLAKIRSQDSGTVPVTPTPSMLLLTRRSHGQVLTVRCSSAMRKLLEAADGHRSPEDLALVARLSSEDVSSLLRQLQEIGAAL